MTIGRHLSESDICPKAELGISDRCRCRTGVVFGDMWNQHEAAQMRIPRSSNIAEGWHHGFHSMLSCSKPTIWKFLDCLKAEQALTDVKKTKRDGRELPEPRAPKWIRYDRQLQRIVDDYDNYSNPMDFLKAIGNLTML